VRVGVVVASNGCAWLYHWGNVADSVEEVDLFGRAVPFSLLSAQGTQSYYCLSHRINKNKIPETKVTVEGSPSRNITRKHDLDPNK
jgi:hypothetical protein